MPAKPRRSSTRSEILRFIKIKGRAAIAEISRAFEITPMAVRRHVLGLRNAGLIRLEMQRHRKGRPAALCLLTDLGDGLFSKTYDRFSAELLRSVSCLDGEGKIDRLFQKRNDQTVVRFAGRMDGKNRQARVREAVAILCEEGYMAESRQVNARTFLITEHNCAIAHIAREYPQACQGELCFLERLLRAEVQRQAHVLKGDSECSYLVRFPGSSKPPRKGKFWGKV